MSRLKSGRRAFCHAQSSQMVRFLNTFFFSIDSKICKHCSIYINWMQYRKIIFSYVPIEKRPSRSLPCSMFPNGPFLEYNFFHSKICKDCSIYINWIRKNKIIFFYVPIEKRSFCHAQSSQTFLFLMPLFPYKKYSF